MDKDYWKLKKREQRAKKKEISEIETLRKIATFDEARGEYVPVSESAPKPPTIHANAITKCLAGIDPKEWKYALERSERAKKYALMFPDHVRLSEMKFQDPLWQWENEVRGRFSGKVGGDSQLR